MLKFVQHMAKQSPDVVFGDGIERSRDSPEIRNFGRRLASEGMVLLKNEKELLPLKKLAKRTKVAIIGPSAKGHTISGGGAAQLKPTYVVTPYKGITTNAPEGFEFEYHVGTYCEFIAWPQPDSSNF